MSSASDGPAGVDGATEAFRQMLVDADEDSHARTLALLALSKRTVFAAAWPNVAEAVRTLTNSDGESAMPLFTGRDVLFAAAGRFGWLGSDGNPVYRELEAVEALRSALSQGVHYVVIDICADHALEFARDEIEAMLGATRRKAAAASPPARALEEVVRRSSRPPRSEQAFGTSGAGAVASVATAGGGLGDIDLPFAAPSAGTSNPAPAPRNAAVVPDLDAPHLPAPNMPAPNMPAPNMPAPQAAHAPHTPAPQAAHAPGTSMLDSLASAFDAPGSAPSVPPAFAAPAAEEATPSDHSVQPPPLDAPALSIPAPAIHVMPLDQLAAANAPPPDIGEIKPPGMAGGTLGGGFGLGARQPEAKPGALQAAAMMTRLGEMAGDKETARAAAEVAAMLKERAAGGGEPDSSAQQAGSAARSLAKMLTGDSADDGDGDGDGEQADEEHVFANLLSDAVFNAIGDQLRQYPEVEWACQIADDGDSPVIGLRVDPSFTTRAGEITAAIEKAASDGGSPVVVEMLTDIKTLKQVRSEGEVFFPWRKKRA